MRKGIIELEPALEHRLVEGNLVLDMFNMINSVEADLGEEKVIIAGVNPNGGKYVPREMLKRDLKLMVVAEYTERVEPMQGSTEEAQETKIVKDRKITLLDNSYYNLALGYLIGNEIDFELNESNRATIGNKAKIKQAFKNLVDKLDDPDALQLFLQVQEFKNISEPY